VDRRDVRRVPELIVIQPQRGLDERRVTGTERVREDVRQRGIVVLTDLDELTERRLSEKESQAGYRENQRDEARDREVAKQLESGSGALLRCL
jgi:hypothetical protein